MKMMIRVLLLACVLCCAARASTIHVPDDEPTIRAGVDAASVGDTVIVACGSYMERGIVLKSGVVVTSATGDPACVTVDGQALGTIFQCMGVDGQAALIGITMTRGAAAASNGTGRGGAMHCIGSSLRVLDCFFVKNDSDYGGGAASCDSASGVIFDGCSFSENRAFAGSGGAVWCRDSAPLFLDSDFDSNQSGYMYGGAIICSYCVGAAAHGCTFTGNSSTYGGGVAFLSGTGAAVTECSFSDNVSMKGGAIYAAADLTVAGSLFIENTGHRDGGGLSLWYADVSLADCQFIANQSDEEGGAISAGHSEFTLDGCVLTANAGPDAGAILCSASSAASLTGCTVADNVSGTGSASGVLCGLGSAAQCSKCIFASGIGGSAFRCDDDGEAALDCCDVWGNEGGDWVGCIGSQSGAYGNFSADPLFCHDANPGAPHALYDVSPCVPASSPCGELVGACPAGCQSSLTRPASWGYVKALFRR